MVASVQELILAANAKRDESPLISIAKALASGYDSYRTSKTSALEDLARQVSIQKNQQDIQLSQAVEQRKAAQRAKAMADEQALKNNFRSISGEPSPVMPVQKLTKVTDEEGNVTTSTTFGDSEDSLNSLLTNKVKSGEMTLQEAIKLKNTSGGGVTTAPAGYRFKNDGTLEKIPGGPADTKQTDSQANARLFGTRADEANSQINSLIDTGSYNPSSVTSIKDNLPNAVGGNFLRSSEAQKYKQAKTNFLTAVLRKESGATIQPSEFTTGDEQYFPMPGDNPDVIAQKRQNRETAIRLIQSAGGMSESSGSNPNYESKIIGGTTYIKKDGKWYAQ